jgi:hypothetical protein
VAFFYSVARFGVGLSLGFGGVRELVLGRRYVKVTFLALSVLIFTGRINISGLVSSLVFDMLEE